MAPKAPKIVVPPPPKPTPAELERQEKESLAQDIAFQQAGFNVVRDPTTGKLKLEQRPKTPQELQDEEFDKQARDFALRKIRGQVTPEEEALVDAAFRPSEERGMESIRQFGIELAGQRGLSLSDTPIGKEVLSAQERLLSNLGGARAASLLNIGSTQQQFGLGLQEFQRDLQQRAMVNRLALAGQTGQSALGLGQIRANLFRPTVVPGSPGLGGSALSGGLGMLGSLGSGWLMSGGSGAAAGLGFLANPAGLMT